ncbi:hypothetical protein [Novosphingobium sp. GV055]|nr:hypothetical protein [Novosphingobium sp. GV055]
MQAIAHRTGPLCAGQCCNRKQAKGRTEISFQNRIDNVFCVIIIGHTNGAGMGQPDGRERTGSMRKPCFDITTLDRAAAYLASCANAKGEISGGYSWRIFAEIAGEDPQAPAAGLAIFIALENSGRVIHLPSVPGTYGHSVFRIEAMEA